MIDALRNKILETIQRDVNNLFVQSTAKTLSPESQEALVKYLKAVSDAKIEAKERDLDEALKRADEAIARAEAKTAGVN